MSLSERGVCSRALQAGGRPCPRPLFPEPVPPYVAQAEQQFAYGEAFLPGYLNLPGVIQPSAQATRSSVRPSLSMLPGFSPWAAGSKAAEYILPLAASVSLPV